MAINNKYVGTVAVLLVAAASGLLVFFLLADSPKPSPKPKTDPDQKSDAGKPDPVQPDKPATAPENIEPDPVRNERPPQPYVLPSELPRLIVEGRVVDGNGVGLADAEVLFTGDMALRGMQGVGFTDGAGNYQLLAWSSTKPAASGSTTRRGTISARSADGGQGVSPTVTVPDGESFLAPPVAVNAGGAIEGVVLNTDGAPAPGARVTVRSATPVPMPDFRGREPRVVTRPLVRMVQADERGQFKAAALPAAQYRVTADPGYWGQNTNAATVDVAEGRSAWSQVELRAENYIRGRVVDALGNPVPDAVVFLTRPPVEGETPGDLGSAANRITARDRGGDVSRIGADTARRFDESSATNSRQMTDAQGRFGFFTLEDIEWTVVARVGAVEARLEKHRVNLPDITLTLETPGKALVSGRVTDAETGLPVSAFDLRVFAGSGSADPDPFSRVAPDRMFPWRPSGEYRLVNPPAGEFRLRFTAPGFVPQFVQIKALGDGEHRAAANAELLPLCELYMTPTLNNRRFDFEPVMLMFDNRIAYQASTDALGNLRIPGVAPGKYRLKLVQRDGTALQCDVEVPARRRAELSVTLDPAG